MVNETAFYEAVFFMYKVYSNSAHTLKNIEGSTGV